MTQDSIMSAERFHELIADEAKRELRDMRVIGQLKLPYLIPLLKARDEAIRNAALEEVVALQSRSDNVGLDHKGKIFIAKSSIMKLKTPSKEIT